jgi:hypothetical protein
MEFRPRAQDERLFSQRRAYAYADALEPENPEPGEPSRAFLDSFDADWFDSRDRVGPMSFGEVSDAPISILTVEESFGNGPFTKEFGGWWEIDLQAPKISAQHYASLFHLPVERMIGYPQRPPPDVTEALDSAPRSAACGRSGSLVEK